MFTLLVGLGKFLRASVLSFLDFGQKRGLATTKYGFSKVQSVRMPGGGCRFVCHPPDDLIAMYNPPVDLIAMYIAERLNLAKDKTQRN